MQNKKTLLLREWISLGCVGGFLASLVIIVALSEAVSPVAVSSAAPFVELQVTGAVVYPGTYRFPPGISIKEVLREVRLTKEADRKQLPLKKHFYRSGTLTIVEKKREVP